MNRFTKRLISSVSIALISFIIVLNLEGWARLSGDMNRDILLLGTLFIFVLVFLSIFFLFKANSEREKPKLFISVLTSLFPLAVFVMNGIIFTVWFIAK